jgi:crotonobetainyl-CoA:carnitine CoA-transferase CaiB-like acyl-CoA transferase
MAGDNADGPLQGIRVLEFGSLIAGPFATRLLADFGAEVIKVEPRTGDPLRRWGDIDTDGQGDSWWWYGQARNKTLISVDLNRPEGQDIARDLGAKSNLLIENLRPRRMADWGLGHDDLTQLNPNLVYVSISGFGQGGPYGSRVGFGNIAESMGGIRYVTGFPDRPPVRVGLSLGDEIAAMYAVLGALMSLLRQARAKDSQGEYVDVALTEAVFSFTESALTEYAHEGIVQERTGNQLLRSAPSNIYPTSDERWIAIGANTDKIFPRLVDAMDAHADIDGDSRFAGEQARRANADVLDEYIADWTSRQTLSQIWDLLTKYEVPAGPVMNVADIAHDSQYNWRDMIIDATAESGQTVTMPGIVPKLRNHPGGVTHAGRSLGHDTDAVLSSLLEWSADDIAAARAENII